MEQGVSLPHLQETAKCCCPERNEFIPYPLNRFFTIHFNIIISAKEIDNRALFHGASFRTALRALYQ